MLNYKKTKFWVIVVAFVVSVAVYFLINPINKSNMIWNKHERLEDYQVIEQAQGTIRFDVLPSLF